MANIFAQIYYSNLYFLVELKRNKEGELIWEVDRRMLKRDESLPLVKIGRREKHASEWKHGITSYGIPTLRLYTTSFYFLYKDGDLNQQEHFKWLKNFYSWLCSLGASRKD